MQRDPMDELIDDLDRVVLPEREQIPQMPSNAETCYWTDRLLYDRPLTPADLDGTAKRVKEDVEDDPAFQEHVRQWCEWRTRLDLGAKGTVTSDPPTRTRSGKPEK